MKSVFAILSRTAIAAFMATAFALATAPVSAEEMPYDHMHLRMADPAAGAAWYAEHMGGELQTGSPAVKYKQTIVRFFGGEDVGTSHNAVIDHIGFSFANLEEKVAELEAAGVKVTMPVREIPNLFKIAFVEDPWGGRIELAEDLEWGEGFHHIHLRDADPEAMLAWLHDSFGGERKKLGGLLDVIDQGGVLMAAMKSEAPTEPSDNHVFDHLGYATKDIEKAMAELSAKGSKQVGEIRAMGPVKFGFVEGPSGVLVEIVQWPN